MTKTIPARPALMPADTPDHMAPAWAGCVSWAIGNPEVMAAFRTETGNTWQLSRTPIDRAIDTATGAERAFMEAFVRWVNVNVWGPVDPADVEGLS